MIALSKKSTLFCHNLPNLFFTNGHYKSELAKESVKEKQLSIWLFWNENQRQENLPWY